jgi:hypothetical protein
MNLSQHIELNAGGPGSGRHKGDGLKHWEKKLTSGERALIRTRAAHHLAEGKKANGNTGSNIYPDDMDYARKELAKDNWTPAQANGALKELWDKANNG